MRISESEIQIIKQSILKYIDKPRIFLFGSRVDDKKKGGDIDIFVESSQDISLTQQIKILTEIEMKGLNRKVDLIIKAPNVKEKSIFQTAIETGILL